MTNTLIWQSSEDKKYYGICVIWKGDQINLGIKIWVVIKSWNRYVRTICLWLWWNFRSEVPLRLKNYLVLSRYLREWEDRTDHRNQYTFFCQEGWQDLYWRQRHDHRGWEICALRVKGKILEEGDIVPCLSARFSVKVSNWRWWKGIGKRSGGLTGSAWLLQKTIKNFTTYLNADVTIPGQAYDQVDISLQPFYDIMLGAEYKLLNGCPV